MHQTPEQSIELCDVDRCRMDEYCLRMLQRLFSRYCSAVAALDSLIVECDEIE